jgi:hypothetical protein
VDESDPRDVVEALLGLAATGVVPEDATRFLEGGDPAIATELFMLTAEGIDRAHVGAATADGLEASCSVELRTAYGADATADVTLRRPRPGAAWSVALIDLETRWP